jgi:carboxyl-terminal processing protease
MRKIATTMLLVAAMALSMNAQNRYEKISNCVDIYNALLRELAINYVDSIDYDKITAEGMTRMLYELDPYTVF